MALDGIKTGIKRKHFHSMKGLGGPWHCYGVMSVFERFPVADVQEENGVEVDSMDGSSTAQLVRSMFYDCIEVRPFSGVA